LDKDWEVNQIGLEMLQTQIDFAKDMIGKLENNENAYVLEQLGWLKIEESFDVDNNVEKMVKNYSCNNVEEYLGDLHQNETQLFEKQRHELQEFITPNFEEMIKKLHGRHDREVGKTILNRLFDICNIPYFIFSDDTTRKTVNGKKQTYWLVKNKNDSEWTENVAIPIYKKCDKKRPVQLSFLNESLKENS
jgi:hypothetical protein